MVAPSKVRPHLEPFPPPGSGCLLFHWPSHAPLCPGLPQELSPFISHHLAMSLRPWKVARSWHRLSTEICWPVCWAWLGGPQLSPDSMEGEVSAAQRVVSQGRQMDSPEGEATWQGRVVVKCSSLGFITKMLFGWQEHTCPQQEWRLGAPMAPGRLLWEGWSHGPCS